MKRDVVGAEKWNGARSERKIPPPRPMGKEKLHGSGTWRISRCWMDLALERGKGEEEEKLGELCNYRKFVHKLE